MEEILARGTSMKNNRPFIKLVDIHFVLLQAIFAYQYTLHSNLVISTNRNAGIDKEKLGTKTDRKNFGG
jgi:hypothetical protein